VSRSAKRRDYFMTGADEAPHSLFAERAAMKHTIPAPRCLAAGVIVLLLSLAPRAAHAQGWYADWQCAGSQCAAVMGGSSGTAGPFSSSPECEAWRARYISSSNCRFGGASSTQRPRTPGETVLSLTAIGIIVGGLAGSLDDDPSGQSFWIGGAALGGGGLGLISLAMEQRKLSTPAVLVLGALGGAALGWGAGRYQYQFGNQGAQQRQSALNQVSSDAAAGALIGFGVFGAFKLLGGAKMKSAPPIVRALASLRVNATPHRVGLNVPW
jgi:hypothetical protein